jgi:LAO/AO transport system kinase
MEIPGGIKMENMGDLSRLTPKSRDLVERMLAGDRRALARLMTLVEARPVEIYQVMACVSHCLKGAPRLGITGPPGAGKSTLIDQLIRVWRQRGQTVGAVAVDPSSPFTGGAVLGDRVRMQQHSLDQGVFIRSLGSRGSHGGVSRATMEIACLLDAFGMNQILIETVGVGQTELDIIGLADTTAVVLVPEAGDTIQTLKAGLMEIGDVFIINKADRDGADRIAAEVRTMLDLIPNRDGWSAPVIKCVAREGTGVEEILDAVDQHRAFCEARPRAEAFRRDYLKRWLVELVLAEMSQRLRRAATGIGAGLFESVARGQVDPYSAAARLLADPAMVRACLELEREEKKSTTDEHR